MANKTKTKSSARSMPPGAKIFFEGAVFTHLVTTRKQSLMGLSIRWIWALRHTTDALHAQR